MLTDVTAGPHVLIVRCYISSIRLLGLLSQTLFPALFLWISYACPLFKPNRSSRRVGRLEQAPQLQSPSRAPCKRGPSTGTSPRSSPAPPHQPTHSFLSLIRFQLLPIDAFGLRAVSAPYVTVRPRVVDRGSWLHNQYVLYWGQLTPGMAHTRPLQTSLPPLLALVLSSWPVGYSLAFCSNTSSRSTAASSRTAPTHLSFHTLSSTCTLPSPLVAFQSLIITFHSSSPCPLLLFLTFF